MLDEAFHRRSPGPSAPAGDHDMSEFCPMFVEHVRQAGRLALDTLLVVSDQAGSQFWRFPWRVSGSTTLRVSALKFLTSSVISVPRSR